MEAKYSFINGVSLPRTGADEATTLTTNKALTFGTLVVPAGDYTIYTQPGESEFLLIINRELGQYHTTYHPAQDLGRLGQSQPPRTRSRAGLGRAGLGRALEAPVAESLLNHV